MKKHHEVKILPVFYEAISEGRKTYEVRLNDREYQNADTITLKEWDKQSGKYTGNELTYEIGHVLHLKDFFMNDNPYVIFSLLERAL